jgi:hypothetical protein
MTQTRTDPPPCPTPASPSSLGRSLSPSRTPVRLWRATPPNPHVHPPAPWSMLPGVVPPDTTNCAFLRSTTPTTTGTRSSHATAPHPSVVAPGGGIPHIEIDHHHFLVRPDLHLRIDHSGSLEHRCGSVVEACGGVDLNRWRQRQASAPAPPEKQNAVCGLRVVFLG